MLFLSGQLTFVRAAYFYAFLKEISIPCASGTFASDKIAIRKLAIDLGEFISIVYFHCSVIIIIIILTVSLVSCNLAKVFQKLRFIENINP